MQAEDCPATMLLQIRSIGTSSSDFWRPRLTMMLEPPRLGAGLYRLCLTTRRPGYATLRLTLDGWPAPMTVFLDRIGSCVYAKSFSIPRPVASMELEIEPHLDAGAVVSVDMEPLG